MAIDHEGRLIQTCLECGQEFVGFEGCSSCKDFNRRMKPTLDRLDKLENLVRDIHGLHVRFK
jgi:hypothetical protein